MKLKIKKLVNNNLFKKKHTEDFLLATCLFFIGLILFGWNMNSLGFYSDDAGFFYSLGKSTTLQTFREFLAYVPGRNLHILWQKIIFIFFGWSPENLPALHLFQSICESLSIVLFYTILRKFEISKISSFVGALAFLIWPTRNDVHFWISSLPMNIFSTIFFLLFIYTTQELLKKISDKKISSINKLLVIDTIFYVLSLFTYDQVFFVLFFILFFRTAIIFKKIKRLPKFIIAQIIIISLILFGYLFYKTNYSSLYGGPTFSVNSIHHIFSNFLLSVDLNFTKISMNFDPIANEILTNNQIAFIKISCFFLLAIISYLLYKEIKNAKKINVSNKKNLLIVLTSIALFLLAYLPVYIWYLSTRHNYLPTIFIASALASILELSKGVLLKNKVLFIIIWLFIIFYPFRLTINKFEENILKSSNIWVTSYSLRKKISEELIRKKRFNENIKCFVILNAPPIYKIAPLYASEQTTFAINYLAEYSFSKLEKNNCENKITLQNNCFNIKEFANIRPDEILAIKIKDFDAYADDKLTYSVLNQCPN